MRDGLLVSCTILLVLLLTLSFSLSEEKKVTLQVITVVDNETLISKSVKDVSCDDRICNTYYAHFENQTEQVSEQTYNKIKEGQKVTLTVHDKSLSWLSIFIIGAIGFLCMIMLLCFTVETKYESGGEYYG